MIWLFLKRFPKAALVIAIITISSALFGAWWLTRSLNKQVAAPVQANPDLARRTQLVSQHFERLVLIDNDLFDTETGELLFKDWLKNGTPLQIAFDKVTGKIIARYERGFVRYNPDGSEDVRLISQPPLAFSSDSKSAFFVNDKDIWRGDLDWQAFKIINERKLTSVEQFNERFFSQNIILETGNTLVVRDMNRLLHINLITGDVKQLNLRLDNFAKRRSPDSKSLVGTEKGQFYCCDVNKQTANTVAIGRLGINDYLWLDNSRCLVIANMQAVLLYDKSSNQLSEVTELPSRCTKISHPSPDGRFVFCVGGQNGVLVDVEKKTATPIQGGAGVTWISDDTYALSRDVPDSNLRGTWLHTVGQEERRVSPTPFLAGNSGGYIMAMPGADAVVFATGHGLFKMGKDGANPVEVIKFARMPSQVLAIGSRKTE